MDLVTSSTTGLTCKQGGFYIDPSAPVDTAVITHAHGDHATAGHKTVHCLASCEALLRHRIGDETDYVAHAPGETFSLGEASVSLHPAGHILGSAQVRIEADETWVVSGDYKRQPDPTCTAFESLECDALITESTFAVPVYRFPDGATECRRILDWWQENKREGRTSILYCYALGKAQRILAELAALAKSGAFPAETVYAHGAMLALTGIYRDAGIDMLPLDAVGPKGAWTKAEWAGRLVLAPPSVRRSPWLKRFGDHETAFASGWMRIRGARRRRGLNRGFILSDHADWHGVLRTVEESKAKRVLCTHGHAETLARYLREERGLDASAIKTQWRGEEGAES